MSKKIAFLGLGVMGFPMAGHLANAGHNIVVYNRTTSKANQWLEKYNGAKALTPVQAAENADIVFACVGNDEDVREITTGENGAFTAMGADTVFVDHTTTSANLARDLYEVAKQKNIHFIDAPVSGGQAGAENGALTVMMGGDQEAIIRVAPFIDHFAKMQQRLGPSGSGQLTKMVNQICIAGIVQGLSEAIHFAKSADLDAPAVMDIISGGAAQSWQMDNRAATMIKDEFDFGFAVDWMRKDLGFVLEEARRNGATLPLTAMVDQFYGQVQNLGGARHDTSSLIVPLEKTRMAKPKN